MPYERTVGPSFQPDDEAWHTRVRPRSWDDFPGQKRVVENLRIALEAARSREEPLEHVLLSGPPGLGKTSLASIIAEDLGVRMVTAAGPAIERPGDLVGILTNLHHGDVLFIDEIHRLSRVVEEKLYGAMEDFQISLVTDKGPYARTISLPLKHFTLIGATTRIGLLTAPLRDRFGIHQHLEFYDVEELSRVLRRAGHILNMDLDEGGIREVAGRSRGTPRIALRLLRRVRDFAQVRGNGVTTAEVADAALHLQGVDKEGLDELDRRFLSAIIHNYRGGPVGIEAIAATLNEETDTLVDVVEPYLLKEGFVIRTPTGRKASLRAYRHLRVEEPPTGEQPGLFNGSSPDYDEAVEC